jgi:shikimate dehydrogenase
MPQHFIRGLSSGTKIVGVFGHPIGHSLSPLMHNTAFALLGLDYIYLAFDVHPHHIEAALRGISALGIVGANVTIPHKETVIPFLDEVAGEASLVGAVNTIVNEGERLVGYNTDIFGFVESLKEFKQELQDTVFTVIGSGGAARAVVYSLTRFFRPKVLYLINRDRGRAEMLRKYAKEKLNYDNVRVFELYSDDAPKKLEESTLIVNATSVGMFPKINECVIDENVLHEDHIVYDLVYNPLETELIRRAAHNGARTMTGLDMLIYQGAKAFEMWTNQQMPLGEIKKVLIEQLTH